MNRDLPELYENGFAPALVISANQHGYLQTRYRVDLAVCCDKKHCAERVHMGEFMRRWPSTIVSRWSFADYRLGDWRFIGSSGLTAVAVAAALGCNPIVATGLDFWSTGREYFHTPAAVKRKGRRAPHTDSIPTHQRKTLGALEAFTRGANIRAPGGLMAAVFGRYKPFEQLPPHRPIAYRRAHFGETMYGFTSPQGFKFANQDIVPAGTTLALTREELKVLQASGQLI